MAAGTDRDPTRGVETTQLLRDLDEAKQALDHEPPDVEAAKVAIDRCRARVRSASKQGKRLRGTKVGGYAVEEREDGSYLIERRVGRPSDFVVPTAIIEAICKVLSEQEGPIAVRDLEAILIEREIEIATWKLRVVMRFLSNADFALARRQAGRFEVVGRPNTARHLRELWERLRHSS